MRVGGGNHGEMDQSESSVGSINIASGSSGNNMDATSKPFETKQQWTFPKDDAMSTKQETPDIDNTFNQNTLNG
jgi:hypothetical protein